MVARLDTFYTQRAGYHQALAKKFAAILLDEVKNRISEVSQIDSYQTPDNKDDARRLLQQLIYPKLERAALSEQGSTEHKPDKNFTDSDWAIEISYKPGVRDNVGITATGLLERLAGRNIPVYSSKVYLIKGKLTLNQVEKIAATLYNSQIQKMRIIPKAELQEKGLGFNIPTINLGEVIAEQHTHTVNLKDANDAELVLIGSNGVPNIENETGKTIDRRGPLSLNLDQMKAIKEHFRQLGRNPTDIELESIAQTWSEHCKHTIFASPILFKNPETGEEEIIKEGLFKYFIKRATDEIKKPNLKVSVFKDNAGAIEFDNDFLICDKAETHNSPSALDPYGGAITGILGAIRDILGFGLGAKPIANAYGFCAGRPDDTEQLRKGDKTDPAKQTILFSPRRILEGLVEGVKDGGNQSGIPTNLGFTLFNDSYKGKPLVFVRTLGIIPKILNGKKSYEKKAQAGDNIVIIGGKVGKDGIHGATFSSESLNGGSPTSAVQIGDSYTQKKLADALLEARDKGLFNSVTDNGAGGLSCSVAEMAKEAGNNGYGGFDVDLNKVPLKYPGLKPWEIWISESQERMTLSVPDDKLEEFKQIMKDHDVDLSVIGRFNDSGKCKVTYNQETIMDLDMEFLHDGIPLPPLATQVAKTNTITSTEAEKPAEQNIAKGLLAMLSRFNLASNEFISKQYDHEVQGGSVIKPLQGYGRVNGDAAVFKPVLNSNKAVVMAQGINPGYSRSDTYHMAACAIDTAIRNAVAAGADPEKIALMDNFCWYKGKDPESLWKLTKAAQACYEFATRYGTPFISGKDSMFNDFNGFDAQNKDRKISIDPTLLISSLSVIDDANKAVGIDAKHPGDLVYVLGETKNELAETEYAAYIKEQKEKTDNFAVPKVHNAAANLELYKKLHKAIQGNLVASSIALSRGGLANALFKTAMAGMKGLDISLANLRREQNLDNNAAALFSESQGRILVTVNPANKANFERTINSSGIHYQELGRITDQPTIKIKGLDGNMALADINLDAALSAYKGTFAGF